MKLEVVENLKLPERFKRGIYENLEYLINTSIFEEVWLFGSCARQDITYKSDLDFLVISKEDIDDYKRGEIYGELCDIPDKINVDVKFYRQGIFEKGLENDNLFEKLVNRDRILLWRKDNG